MAAESDAPVDLYIVTYAGRDGAQADWSDIKRMATDKVLAFKALVLVRRDTDGKIDIKDDAHSAGGTTAMGTVGGLVVGIIFPPTLLAAGLVGAGIGAGVGGLRSHAEKRGDQGRDRGRPPARQLRDRRPLRRQMGGRDLREVAAAGRQGHQHEVDRESSEQVKAPASA